ncbi:hypothetical protein PoB_003199400 [Plakobranchus ocellatus]|uniref:Uncharacterized protein n=1 Tax=Plakobranchus ocellatus TaxID=259542 RepID=A0AAV4AGW5_9GAST|nr:hypothetical protein PoB_003199400 [Plakobranchus ocellatus]
MTLRLPPRRPAAQKGRNSLRPRPRDSQSGRDSRVKSSANYQDFPEESLKRFWDVSLSWWREQVALLGVSWMDSKCITPSVALISDQQHAFSAGGLRMFENLKTREVDIRGDVEEDVEKATYAPENGDDK